MKSGLSHDLNAVSFPSVVRLAFGFVHAGIPNSAASRQRGRYTNFYQLRGHGQIAKSQLLARSPEHDERNDVGRDCVRFSWH